MKRQDGTWIYTNEQSRIKAQMETLLDRILLSALESKDNWRITVKEYDM